MSAQRALRCFLCCLTLRCLPLLVRGQTETDLAREYLEWYNPERERISNQLSLASWAYNTNLTDHNQQLATAANLISSEFYRLQAQNASRFNLSAIDDFEVRRQLDFILDVGISGYNNTGVQKRISEVGAEMRRIYSEAKWCRTSTECLALEPDLVRIISTSRDYNLLRDAWKGWRDVSGKKMRALYEEFVGLMNEAIRAGGKYEDTGDYYRSWYETPTFEEDVKALFDELRPLYNNLHAYVRRKLRLHYGRDKFPTSGHIPAHLLGNMWAQSWNNIYDLVEPYPNAGRTDITQAMLDQNYTVRQMYELAEDFFVSMGLQRMPNTFWTNSMLVKPDDGREVVCHASAWDFNNGTDFRIKQCTEVTEDQLITVHHEMGHVQYYLEYKTQPVLFRRGANPGFHEGVADIVTHSFQTPEHLKKIGLLLEIPQSEEGDINFLMQMALSSVAFLPFGYLIDQWRWSVYRGETTPANYNKFWWELRSQFQGISPPVDVPRTEEHFDPGAKYHVPANTPYIRYFVSHVVQFQWHKALCELIGQRQPKLHRCDIYNSTVAGDRLKLMLRMGQSRPWGQAMLALTNGTSGETDKMSVQPILEFFRPLLTWLEAKNLENGEQLGWTKEVAGPFSSAPIIRTDVTVHLLVTCLSVIMWQGNRNM